MAEPRGDYLRRELLPRVLGGLIALGIVNLIAWPFGWHFGWYR